MRLAHLIVRDQLSICRFFASKVEFEAEKNTQGKSGKSKDKKKDPKKNIANKNSFDEDEYDEIFGEDQSRDLFYDDDDEKQSTDALNESIDSTGNFQTE